MDYLIFLTGLFLLITAVGSLFLYREDPIPTRWPLFAVALATLGIKVWTAILVFAFAPGGWITLADALLSTIYASALLGFSLSPLIGQYRWVFVVKWAVIVAVFGLLFIVGASDVQSRWFQFPLLAVTFAGGWRFATIVWKLPGSKNATPPLISAVLLTIITSGCIIPNIVGVTFDIEGQHFSRDRIEILSVIGIATACSIALCVMVWRTIYQRNRSELSRTMLRRRRIGTTVILVAAVFTSVNGAWLAHWLGNQANQEQTSTLLSALHLGADNISASQIEKIRGHAEEVKTTEYVTIRSKLLQIREALPQNRFTYIVGKREGKTVFLVDAEEPGNEPDFSPPGQVVENPSKWEPAFEGRSIFMGPYKDAWGVWYTAVVPIFDARQNPAGLLDVDYPAAIWIQPLAGRRVAAMGVTLSVSALLVALFVFHLISIETARRVDHLSERLSDAMTAAELDTWEWIPKSYKINIGDRISSTLSLGDSSPTFRKLWRSIHPDDRSQIFNLVRQQQSSEAEVRLRDATGRWLWFLLRGRIIQSHPEDPVRLVGTVLNIDERHRARLEIDKQRRFAQQMMESVPNGLAVITPDGIVSYANPALIRLARSESQPLVGVAISSLIENAKISPRSGGVFETMLNCAEGGPVAVQVYQAPLYENRQDAGSILAIVDLTATKEAELDLLRSRAESSRLALVAKRTDNAVVITNATGHVEWVNEGFTKISGYTRSEVVGKKPGSFLQRPNDTDPARAHMRECIRAGKGFEAEILNYHKNGLAYIVHIECQPLLDKSGTLTGFMAIERDITLTRRTSHLLEAVASIGTTLLSQRIEPSVWSGILQALGSAANVDRCHLFQVHHIPGSDMLHTSEIAAWSNLAYPSKSDLPLMVNLPFEQSGFDRWYRELTAGREVTGVVAALPDGERIPLQARGVRSIIVVPIMAAGRLWGYLGFDACLEDKIWERWEISILRSVAANIGLRQVAQNEADALVLARDEANNAAVAAEKANLAKSTFLATMSHEIRTPLNAVIGMASLLETTSLNAQQKDFAETILNSGNFLLELINDILDYSRIENGHIDMDSTAFVLSDVCREAFDVVRLGAMGKDIELIGRIAPTMPRQLEGDRSRIRQILINLLSNAVKFTPQGFVSLSVEGTRMPDGQWMLTFEVRDSGIGISSEALTRLFRPFTQEDSTTTRRFGGSGLGLAISKRLAEHMGGDITVDSLPGRGSTFIASLLLKPAAPGEENTPLIPPFPAGHAPKILVVDDNSLNRRILEETLANWGLACHSSEGGEEALQAWKESGPYDLVITDQHMPVMDGVTMTRRLISLPEAKDTRFMLISSESNCPPEIRAIFHEVGSKPIWPSSLHAMLTRLFPGSVPEAAKAPEAVSGLESQRLASLKILVAEDNKNNQKVIKLLLKRLGVEPDIVSDGSQAVDASIVKDYDVILLDLQMPVMDGLQASRNIRRLERKPRPFIIALTANVFQEDRDAATAAGMDDYLSKPITLDRLRDMLTSVAASLSLPG